MTSSNLSDHHSECPECGGRLTVRQAHKFPVALNVAFGASFLAFLFVLDKLKPYPYVLWGWSIFQIVLGGFLIRARARSAKRILICIRCEPALRSSKI